MKKMLLAAITLAGLTIVGDAEARLFGRGRYSSPTNNSACGPVCGPVCAPSCAPSCAPACGNSAIPRCFKTIEVPAIERRIKNAPIRRCVKNPDIIEFRDVAPLVIPQEPERICKPVADTVWFEEVPDTVVYECPCDAQQTACGPARCM